MSLNKTFAILSVVLLEHQYINYFIEYHIKLGFNKIYIIIDNSDTIQDEYIIKEEFKPFVIFLDIRTYYTIEEPLKYAHKSDFIHTILQKVYKLYIQEDYTILLGIDSFLFLNNLTIQEYFVKYNIPDDVCQIMFKWVQLYNHVNKSRYNLLENIDSNDVVKEYNMHYFTMGNRKLVIEPSCDSHHYNIKESTGKIWYNNSIYNITNNDNFLTILNNIGYDTTYEIISTGCIYHFLMRDVYDLFIKTYFYWNKNVASYVDNINNIRKVILTNESFDKMNNRLRFINNKNRNNNSVIINVTLNIDSINENDCIYSDKFIDLILSQCDISSEVFDTQIKKFGYTHSTSSTEYNHKTSANAAVLLH